MTTDRVGTLHAERMPEIAPLFRGIAPALNQPGQESNHEGTKRREDHEE